MQTIKITETPCDYALLSLEDIDICGRMMLDNNRQLVIICNADSLTYEAEAVQID